MRSSVRRLSRRALTFGAPALALTGSRERANGRSARGVASVVPVIVLPGIMGSRLQTSFGPIWDADDTDAMFDWAGLDLLTKRALLSTDDAPELQVLDTFAEVALDEVVAYPEWPRLEAIARGNGEGFDDFYARRGWAGPSWRYYGPLLALLEARLNGDLTNASELPHPVYAFGYDWRRSCATSGEALAAFIDGVLAGHPGAAQVVLVTHSMGGLVARAACLDAAVASKVKGVVHASQPSNGSVTIYRRFHTGYVGPYDTGVVDGFQERVADGILSRIMGTTPEDFAVLASGMPGPIELLPNQLYGRYSPEPWLIADPPPDLSRVYDVYRGPSPPGIVLESLGPFVASLGGELTGEIVERRLREQIDGAEAFHLRLADNGHPHTYAIFGTGLKTDARVSFAPSFAVDQPLAGDGSVHESSGACLGLRAGYVREAAALTGVEHASTCTDPAAIEQVLAFVRRILAES